MINWLGRKITGNPCIGCEVRERAFFPERDAARDGMSYLPGIEFDPYEFKLQQVASTCLKAFNGSDMTTSERFETCIERASDPDALTKAMGLRLQTEPPKTS